MKITPKAFYLMFAFLSSVISFPSYASLYEFTATAGYSKNFTSDGNNIFDLASIQSGSIISITAEFDPEIATNTYTQFYNSWLGGWQYMSNMVMSTSLGGTTVSFSEPTWYQIVTSNSHVDIMFQTANNSHNYMQVEYTNSYGKYSLNAQELVNLLSASQSMIFLMSQSAEQNWFIQGVNPFTSSAISAPVPAPSAFWLFGSGLLGFLNYKHRGIKFYQTR